jgi:hypothetical protein
MSNGDILAGARGLTACGGDEIEKSVGSEQRVHAGVLHLAEDSDPLRGEFEDGDRDVRVLENVCVPKASFDHLSRLARQSALMTERVPATGNVTFPCSSTRSLVGEFWCVEDASSPADLRLRFVEHGPLAGRKRQRLAPAWNFPSGLSAPAKAWRRLDSKANTTNGFDILV